MKKQQQPKQKKLVLNKTVITELKSGELNNVKGGIFVTFGCLTTTLTSVISKG